MAVRICDVVRLIWSHPIVSVVVLLLFTPPLFPIVVYFSPLLISTALVVLAMISMKSDMDDTPTYISDPPYKRGWIEEDSEDGPLLDGERVPKRLKASSKDERWFSKVKNWEGTGRAWVESVLSQESRRGNYIYNDGNAATAEDESVPLLEPAPRALAIEDIPNPANDPVAAESMASEETGDEEASLGSADKASPDKPSVESEIADGQTSDAALEDSKDFIEITPASESEDDHVVMVPRDISAKSIFKLFRSKSLSRREPTDKAGKEGLKTENAIPKDLKSSSITADRVTETEIVGKDRGSESEMNTAVANSSPETDPVHLPVVEQEKEIVERAPVIDAGNAAASTDETSRIEAAAKIVPAPENPVSEISVEELNSEVKEVAQDEGENTQSAPDHGIEASTKVGSPESDEPKGQAAEAKSAAELLAPLRQASPYGLGTPSAAVALSEKLKVPLEDIMSLLAGDDKEILPDREHHAGKGSSSETTTSQEEEWSSSDGESPAPLKADGGIQSVIEMKVH